MIDLDRFCSWSPERPYLQTPWSLGDYTYATNGHILVRVDRLPGVADIDVKIDPENVLAGHESANFQRAKVVLPPQSTCGESCKFCNGSGDDPFDHDDNDIHPCAFCDGRGHTDPELGISSDLGGYIFNLAYVRRIVELPDALIAPGAGIKSKDCPQHVMLFSFSGGIGALCPRRCHFDRTVTIEVA